MKVFSIICIVLGTLLFLVFATATEPPVTSYNDLIGFGIISTVLLVALGIVGASTAGRLPAIPARIPTAAAMPYSGSLQPGAPQLYCSACGTPSAPDARFCARCGQTQQPQRSA